eukprot:TRINITY_DN22226_c0_g1_i1.p1 TRINITY_DN22226_c0_g1~~TRINITY_DN22226_c0_g1_i1.p1  ORF type:complete len:339 (+),score=83.90 TRINITY_DN22226_c0_g1_i1:59-1075(+)
MADGEDAFVNPGKTLKQMYAQDREVRFQCSMPMSHVKDDPRLRYKRDVSLRMDMQDPSVGPLWGRGGRGFDGLAGLRQEPTKGTIASKFISMAVLELALAYLQSPALRQCVRVSKAWRSLVTNSGVLRRNLSEFIYTGADYDRQGILFYFGTLFGRRDHWANPSKLPVCPLEVHASSVLKTLPGCDVHNIVHCGVADFATDSLPYSWVVFDFGEGLAVSPTHYTVGTSKHLTCYPASWQLLGCEHTGTGSHMGMWRNWVVLDSVEPCDVRFSPSTHSQTFHVKSEPTHRAYRYLRLLQTSSNQQFGDSFVVSGVEFYGHIVKPNPHACRAPKDLYWGV